MLWPVFLLPLPAAAPPSSTPPLLLIHLSQTCVKTVTTVVAVVDIASSNSWHQLMLIPTLLSIYTQFNPNTAYLLIGHYHHKVMRTYDTALTSALKLK